MHHDMRCDAWNDREKENTWYVFVHAFKEKLGVLVKEGKEGKTTVGRGEFPLPVESIDNEVIGIFDTCTKALGCPDFVTNRSPRKFKPVAFKSWLDYRNIHYRELEADIDEMAVEVPEGASELEVLSLMIDATLSSGVEENNGKH